MIEPRSDAFKTFVVDNSKRVHPTASVQIPRKRNNDIDSRLYEVLCPVNVTIPANSIVKIWTDVRLVCNEWAYVTVRIYKDLYAAGLRTKYGTILWEKQDDLDETTGGNFYIDIKNTNSQPFTISAGDKLATVVNGPFYPAN